MTADRRAHIEEAFRLLNGEAYCITDAGTERASLFCTIANDLRRIDAAIGPSGESTFARMADTLDAVFTEIVAALGADNDR